MSFNYTYGVTIQVTPVLQEDSLRALSAFVVKTEYRIHPEDARTRRAAERSSKFCIAGLGNTIAWSLGKAADNEGRPPSGRIRQFVASGCLSILEDVNECG